MTKTMGVKKMAAQTKSDDSNVFDRKEWCAASLYIIPRCLFLNVCGGCQETGALGC